MRILKKIKLYFYIWFNNISELSMIYRITLCFLLLSSQVFGQGFDPGIPEKHCVSSEELKLYNMISAYRSSKNLPAIEFSKSLSYVAKVHAMDLSFNRPDFGGCNPHSWSDKGKWKSCCYARNENRISCMTLKPKELTGYKSKAFEVVYSGGEEAKAEDAFELWTDIPMMNDYLLNTGKWIKPWLAIGIGIYGEYACLWFGEGNDMAGTLHDCSTILAQNDSVEKQHDVLSNTHGISNYYYIITSSTSTLESAIQEVNKIKEKGFPGAVYLKNESFYRIAVNKFTDEIIAYKELEVVKKQFPDAWLLKPKVIN